MCWKLLRVWLGSERGLFYKLNKHELAGQRHAEFPTKVCTGCARADKQTHEIRQIGHSNRELVRMTVKYLMILSESLGTGHRNDAAHR